jgi:hypothetical protein
LVLNKLPLGEKVQTRSFATTVRNNIKAYSNVTEKSSMIESTENIDNILEDTIFLRDTYSRENVENEINIVNNYNNSVDNERSTENNSEYLCNIDSSPTREKETMENILEDTLSLRSQWNADADDTYSCPQTDDKLNNIEESINSIDNLDGNIVVDTKLELPENISNTPLTTLLDEIDFNSIDIKSILTILMGLNISIIDNYGENIECFFKLWDMLMLLLDIRKFYKLIPVAGKMTVDPNYFSNIQVHMNNNTENTLSEEEIDRDWRLAQLYNGMDKLRNFLLLLQREAAGAEFSEEEHSKMEEMRKICDENRKYKDETRKDIIQALLHAARNEILEIKLEIISTYSPEETNTMNNWFEHLDKFSTLNINTIRQDLDDIQRHNEFVSRLHNNESLNQAESLQYTQLSENLQNTLRLLFGTLEEVDFDILLQIYYNDMLNRYVTLNSEITLDNILDIERENVHRDYLDRSDFIETELNNLQEMRMHIRIYQQLVHQRDNGVDLDLETLEQLDNTYSVFYNELELYNPNYDISDFPDATVDQVMDEELVRIGEQMDNLARELATIESNVDGNIDPSLMFHNADENSINEDSMSEDSIDNSFVNDNDDDLYSDL